MKRKLEYVVLILGIHVSHSKLGGSITMKEKERKDTERILFVSSLLQQ